MHQRNGQDVLRDVVRSVAPAELEKLDETCRVYLARPYPPQPLHRPTGDPLGDGIQTLVLLPVLVAVVAQILADLASGRIRAGGSRLTRWWRRRRASRAGAEDRRDALTNTLPQLADVTEQELTEWAMARIRAVGLSSTQAEACAHVIVVAVVRPAAEPASARTPDANADTRAETRAEADADTRANTLAEADADARAETRAEADTDTRADTRAETDAETRAEADAETRANTLAEAGADARPGAGAGARAVADGVQASAETPPS
ncbi:hypothetical protein ACWCPF_13070 [Streptomyces sp. NPDC001858]